MNTLKLKQLEAKFYSAYHSSMPFHNIRIFMTERGNFDEYTDNEHYKYIVRLCTNMQDIEPDNTPGMIYGMLYSAFSDYLIKDMRLDCVH